MITIEAKSKGMHTLIMFEDISDFDNAVYTECEEQLRTAYDAFLDDLEDAVVLGYKHPTSEALKATDPTMYEVAFLEFLDFEFREAIWELERGKKYEIGGLSLRMLDRPKD